MCRPRWRRSRLRSLRYCGEVVCSRSAPQSLCDEDYDVKDKLIEESGILLYSRVGEELLTNLVATVVDHTPYGTVCRTVFPALEERGATETIS